MHRELSLPIESLSPGQASRLPQQPRLAPLQPLPVLGNREQFAAMVGRQLAACRRMGSRPAVLIIEVDAWGPGRAPLAAEQWPALVQAVGSRLRARVRGTDLVAQWGERRFGVVLLGCGRADLPTVQERLTQALMGAYSLEEQRLQLQLRMGAVAYPEGLVSGGELVSAAEAALMTRH